MPHPEGEVSKTSSFRTLCHHLLLQSMLMNFCFKPGMAAATTFDPTSVKMCSVEIQFLIQLIGERHHFLLLEGHDFPGRVMS